MSRWRATVCRPPRSSCRRAARRSNRRIRCASAALIRAVRAACLSRRFLLPAYLPTYLPISRPARSLARSLFLSSAAQAHPHPPTGRRKTRSGLVNPVTGRFDELRVCNGEVDRALVVTRDPLRSVKAEASRQVSSGLFDQHARAVMFTPGLNRTLPLVAKELALAMEPTWRRGEGMFADLVGASGAADRDKPLAEREDVMVMRFEDIASKEPGVREAALGAALRFVGVCPSAEQLRCAFIDPHVTREKRAQHNGTVTAAWPPPEGAANVDAAVQSFLEYFGGPRGPLARAMSSSSFSSKGEAKLGIFSARHMRLATILALRTEAKLLIEAKYKPLTVEDAACAVAATLEETLWSMPGGDDWRALGYERTPVQPLEGRVQHLPRRRRARGRAGGPAATSAP